MLSAAIVSALWASLSLLQSVEAAPVMPLASNSTIFPNSTLPTNATVGPLFNTTVFAPGTMPGMYASNFSRLVMFGDSLSDNGNGSRVLSNGTVPNPKLYWHYRWSDGPVWVEDLAERLNVTLVDYAIGGATVNNSRVPGILNVTKPVSIPSALEQINSFVNQTNSSLAHSTLDSTLFAIWIGANDILDTFQYPTPVNSSDLVADVFVGIEKLKAVGAKHILINTMPDIGATPLGTLVGPKAAAVLTKKSVDYRTALMSAVDAQAMTAMNMTTMSTSVPSAHIAVVDAFLASGTILSQPQAYGFANSTIHLNCVRGFSSIEMALNITQSICPQPDSYFFWDTVHPTRVVHSLFAQLAASSLLKAKMITRK